MLLTLMEYQDNSSQVKNLTGTMEMVVVLKNSMPMVTLLLTVLVRKISIKKLNSHGFLLVIKLILLQYLILSDSL